MGGTDVFEGTVGEDECVRVVAEGVTDFGGRPRLRGAVVVKGCAGAVCVCVVDFFFCFDSSAKRR